MKMLLGLLSLVMSLSSFASSGETKTFFYDGSRPSVELVLKGEKTHTEYRYETRPGTCFRTVVVGYRTVCSGGARPGQGPVNCSQTPIYRQVAYSCPQTVQIPYEVKDYDVEARFIIDVTKLSEVAASETFTVTLNGDDLSISAKGSKKFLIVQKKKEIRSNMSGSVMFLDGLLAVEMVEAATVLETLKMSKMNLNGNLLSFNLGPIKNPASFGYSLKAVKNRRLGTDIVLFNRELNTSEIDFSSSVDSTLVSMDLSSLGIDIDGKKSTLTARVFFKTEGALMNQSQFGGELEAKKVLVVNDRK